MMEPLVVERFSGEIAGQGVLCLKGPLTAENLLSFQNAFRRDDSAAVVLDFSDVPYVDSAGLGSLVSACISRHKTGGKMALSGINDRVLKLFEITKTDSIFLIFPTVELAMEALTQSAQA